MADYEKAIEDYSRCLEGDRNDAVAYKHRGMAYLVVNNIVEARQDFLKAIFLGYDRQAILSQASAVYGDGFSLE